MNLDVDELWLIKKIDETRNNLRALEMKLQDIQRQKRLSENSSDPRQLLNG